MICDAHVHFFSSGFYRTLAASWPGDSSSRDRDGAVSIPAALGWTAPGDDAALADTWAAELDRQGVERAMLIASLPGDEASVAAAVTRHPTRFVGAFMWNPAATDAASRLESAFAHPGMRVVCLFPAMHHVPVDDPRAVSAFELCERHGRSVFVHCGVLSVGIRKKLGLPSPFDIRLGDPLAVAAVAVRHPAVPVIVPHFGAGFFHEALMAASVAPNIVFDTSSTNAWTRFHPDLTLSDVLARTIELVGPGRLMFGTDSSFFPRGWQRAIYEQQRELLTDLGVEAADQAAIFGGNFNRLLLGSQRGE